MRVPAGERTTVYEGVRSQRVARAIAACADSVMPERLELAARRGRAEGYITACEQDELGRELGW